MIGHHVVTFGLAFIGAAPYVPFYAIFFFGLANLSSVPLVAFTLCDALRSQYPAFETPFVINQGLFAILFLLVRVGVRHRVEHVVSTTACDNHASTREQG